MIGYNGAGAEDAGPEIAKSSDQRLRDNKARQEAQHAEIQQRYSRKWSAQSKPDRIKSVRRGQVLRLLHHRHGATLPDDATGRICLQLLFELGLNVPAAKRLAPWADDEEIARLVKAADRNFADWSRHRDGGDGPIDKLLIPERIGERLEISFDEYKRLSLTHLRPCDAQRHEVDKYITDRRAERGRVRAQRYRAEVRKAVSAAPDPWDLPAGRAKSLACVPLAERRWWSVRELAAFAQEHLGDFDGLDYQAARKAVFRAVCVLHRLDIVEIKKETEHRGLKVLYARRPITAAEIEAERQQLLEEVSAEQEVAQEAT
jgi:hypothetical protein